MTHWWRRVWHLINRRRFERDLEVEMREHRGMMSDPSRFGDSYRFIERSRDAWGWNWLDDASQDIRLGVRALWRSPVFALTAVLILSFGIGLNLTLYQIATVAMIRPPVIQNPETLARFYRLTPNFHASSLPYAATQLIRRQNTALDSVLVESATSAAWGREGADEVEASFVSANWFSELGYASMTGRVLVAGIDDAADASPSVVASDEFWRTTLGADPSVVGATVYINRRPATLVGIAPPGFPGLDQDRPSIWIAIEQREYYFPDSPFLHTLDSNNTRLYGRLREDLSVPAARESLRGTMAALARQHPDHFATDEWFEPVMAAQNFMTARDRAEAWLALWLLAGLTGLVLLVAATNIGNLVLSHAAGRARELGVRIALGARRSRITRQLLAETVPLSVLGAAGAMLFAKSTASVMASLAGLPAYLDFSPDWSSIVVCAGLSLLVVGIVGLLPAWKVTRQELVLAIKDGGQQVSAHLDRARLRRWMLAAQVAGSCLILVVAGMMARRVQHLLSSGLGFEFEQVLILDAKLGHLGFSAEAGQQYWRAVKERVTADPGTAWAAVVSAPPLGGTVRENGYDETPGLAVVLQKVDPEYFRLMQIPLVAGRTFASEDVADGTAIVSERLALEMYGTTDVLGRGFPVSTPNRTIVGVVRNAHSIRITANNAAELYVPLAVPDYSFVFLLARAHGEAAGLAPVMRDAAGVDSRVIPSVRLMRDDFDRRMRGPRLAATVAGGVSLVTLVLACLGIFGVTSHGAALRTKEMGVHLALGASRWSVLRLAVSHVLSPVLLGMVVGFAAAMPVASAPSAEALFLGSVDPAVVAIAVTAFLVAGGVAALVPAMCVLRSVPIRALRHE